jgi:hypothetical protein
MSGLDGVVSLVRAVRLGALALTLVLAVGSSWAAMQPGRGYAAAPARSAVINGAPAAMDTWTYFVIVGGATPLRATQPRKMDPVCFGWVTPDEVSC